MNITASILRGLGECAACCLLVLGSGCATMHCHATQSEPAHAIPEHTERHDLGPRTVLVFKSAKTDEPRPHIVLLLHEIPGFNAATADFAGRLAEKGFTVYAPIMVGKPLESGWWPPLRNFLEVVLSPDWPTLRTSHSPAVLPDLHVALQKIREQHPGEPIGIIGMCMSGTLPLALMSEPGTRIAAVCQPALPMLPWTQQRRRNLALGVDDLNAGFARINTGHLVVLGFRYKDDGLSTAGRLEEIQRHMAPDGGTYRDYQIPPEEDPMTQHATFTSGYGSAATQRRFADLVTEFTRALSHPN